MDYSKFCHYEDRVSSLTKQEIENPHLALNELCTKRTSENFQKDLWNLFWTVFKEDEWIKYDALYLYRTYKDLIRFMDVLWLINQNNPELSMMKPALEAEIRKPDLMRDLKLVFQNMHRLKQGSAPLETENDTLLGDFYKKYHLGFIKSNIYNYLQVGLDASYMNTDKHDYFGLQEYEVISDFLAVNDLIAEGYRIYSLKNAVFSKPESCIDTMFAIDTDHPTQLHYESLKDPVSVTDDFYRYYFNINYIHNGIKIWENMLYEKDLWKKTGNPGNLLHFQECLVRLIDGVWLRVQSGHLEIDAKRYKAKRIVKEIAKNCTKEELRDPFIVIQSFFEFKKMHEWKKQLEEWLECSLSNSDKYENKGKTELSFKYLLKFIEATYLLTYFLIKTKKENSDCALEANQDQL